MPNKLEWPSGWPRTRPGERKEQRGWKKPEVVYRKQVEAELGRMKAFGITISLAPVEIQRLDPGVAVYFSIHPKEDYSWQDILEINDPAPTREQIRDAYIAKSKIYHPDTGLSGDLEMFQRVEEAKRNALQYIAQSMGETFQHVIPCDKFKEVRWNLCAVARAVSYLRGLDRVGIPGFLERGMKGFAALTEGSKGDEREHAQAATRSI